MRFGGSSLSPRELPPGYEKVEPFATYSPWALDADFLRVYNAVEDSTLVDKFRCWELWTLVAQTATLPGGALLEVGVWRGGTGALIALQAHRVGIFEPVYLCDTFEGVVKAGEHDDAYQGGEHADTSEEQVHDLLSQLGVTNAVTVRGTFPDESAGKVDAAQLRFVHIDVDVYESARGVLDWAWPRLVPGGIVVYDDFGFASCRGIAKHVEEQLGEPDRLIVHNLNGHAVVIKR